MGKFGYKEININNICEKDPALNHFVKTDAHGKSIPLSLKDHLLYITPAELNENVPKDIQAMFEVAKGAMAYAYFYYPLFTLATEQLLRISEAALRYKCKELGLSDKHNFADMIKLLTDNGVIKNKERIIWDSIRHLRNLVSHPDSQMILPPGMAIESLYKIAEQINFLFKKQTENKK